MDFRMKSRLTQVGLMGALVIVVVLGGGAWIGGCSFGKAAPAPTPTSLTDLRVGTVYPVAFTRLIDAEIVNGTAVRSREFHFASHSVRSQAIPLRDGRGRLVVRRVTNDPKLPVGTMRLVRVVEADPEFEGLKFGDYHWVGLMAEFNVPLTYQRVVPRIKVRG